VSSTEDILISTTRAEKDKSFLESKVFTQLVLQVEQM